MPMAARITSSRLPGLRLVDLYEDNWPGAGLAIDALTPLYIATLAEKTG